MPSLPTHLSLHPWRIVVLRSLLRSPVLQRFWVECSHRDHAHLDQRHTPAETLLSLHYSDKQPGEQRREMGESRRNEAHEKGDTKTSLSFFLTGSAVCRSFTRSIPWISVSFLTKVPNFSHYFCFHWFYKAFSPFRSSTQMAWHCLFERTSQIEMNWEFCRFQVRVMEVFWLTVFPNLLGEYFMLKLTTCKAVLRS